MAKKEAIKKNSGDENKNSPEMTLMTEDVKGNTFLPGQEIPVIAELVDLVKQIETEDRPAFSKARDRLQANLQLLNQRAHKYIEHFSEIDEKGKRVYRAGGVEISIIYKDEKVDGKIIKDDEK